MALAFWVMIRFGEGVGRNDPGGKPFATGSWSSARSHRVEDLMDCQVGIHQQVGKGGEWRMFLSKLNTKQTLNRERDGGFCAAAEGSSIFMSRGAN